MDAPRSVVTSTRWLLLSLVSFAAACDDVSQPFAPEMPATPEARQPLSLAPSAQVGPDDWIVVFRSGVDDPVGLARALVAQAGGELGFTYQHAIAGFSATLPPQALDGLRNNPQVNRIEPDGVVRAVTGEPAASWGLDRIDQRTLPLDQTYTYRSDGAGVDAYIIDTGIRTSHVDFGGRAWRGAEADFVDDPNGGADGADCHGHGTHVAGTVGGTSYGVAKQVSLHAVQVLGCSGSGTLSGVIAGVDWVTAEHQAKAGTRPSVANMSLSVADPFDFYGSINQAVAASVAAGVVYAVAASNDGADACDYKPASSPDALTVGATTQSDARASFSNFGFCVDLFAPGVSITSAHKNSDTAAATWSGTSMASPHVAGVAALYLGDNPGASTATVEFNILTNTTDGVIGNAGSGSPNKLLYSLITEPPATTPPAAPSGISAGAVSSSRIDVSWSDNSGDESGFRLERSDDGGATWTFSTQLGANSVAYEDSGLTASSTYTYRVRAENAAGESAWDGPANATTHDPPPPPPAPSSLSATAVSHAQIDVSWPDVAGEDGYDVQRSTDGGASWSPAGGVAADVTSFSDAGLEASSTFTYRVSAFNGSGSSGYSPTAEATTLVAPSGTAVEVWEISDVEMVRQGKFRFGLVLVTVREVGTAADLVPGVTVTGDWWRDGETAPFDTSTGVTDDFGEVGFESAGVKGGAQMFFCVTSLSGAGFSDGTTDPACSSGFVPPDTGDPGDPGDPGVAPSGLSVRWESKKGGGRMELSWTPGGGGDVAIYRNGDPVPLKITADNGSYNDRDGVSSDEYEVCLANEGPGDLSKCTARVGAPGG